MQAGATARINVEMSTPGGEIGFTESGLAMAAIMLNDSWILLGN